MNTWRGEAHSLQCYAQTNSFGTWCGYVRVPDGHVLSGKDMIDEFTIDDNDIIFEKQSPISIFLAALNPPGTHCLSTIINIHGGVTFSDNSYWGDDGWWLGFDCAHAGDAIPGQELITPNDVYRDLGYVIAECESLAKQIVEFNYEPA